MKAYFRFFLMNIIKLKLFLIYTIEPEVEKEKQEQKVIKKKKAKKKKMLDTKEDLEKFNDMLAVLKDVTTKKKRKKKRSKEHHEETENASADISAPELTSESPVKKKKKKKKTKKEDEEDDLFEDLPEYEAVSPEADSENIQQKESSKMTSFDEPFKKKRKQEEQYFDNERQADVERRTYPNRNEKHNEMDRSNEGDLRSHIKKIKESKEEDQKYMRSNRGGPRTPSPNHHGPRTPSPGYREAELDGYR